MFGTFIWTGSFKKYAQLSSKKSDYSNKGVIFLDYDKGKNTHVAGSNAMY